MFNWVVRCLKLARLFLLEQIREPVGIMWSMIAPPILFTILNEKFLEQSVSTEWYISQSSWFLGYLAVSTSVFGFALYLIGRRESGFLKSFVQNGKTKVIFLSAQFCASLIIAIFYGVFFVVVTALLYGVDIFPVLLRLMIPYLFVIIIMLVCSAVIIVPPLTFQNANSFVSMLLMAVVLIGLAANRSDLEYLTYLDYVNPLTIAVQFILNYRITHGGF